MQINCWDQDLRVTDLRSHEYTVFINGGRAERPGFECMNARLGRPENADLYFI